MKGADGPWTTGLPPIIKVLKAVQLCSARGSGDVQSARPSDLGANSPHQLVGAVMGKAHAAGLYLALETSGHEGNACGGNLWHSPTPCSETVSLGFQNLHLSQCILLA